MTNSRDYDIAFVGLKPGVHTFDYEVTDKFFEAFQKQDFNNCQAQIKLFLNRESSFLLLKFEIGGRVDVACDRCNSTMPLELWDEFHITVKMVDQPQQMNEEEEDPDVFYISRGESHINVRNWIYEFVNLSIPLHKTCGFENADGPYCNREAIERLENAAGNSNAAKQANTLWKGLEKFKKTNDN